MNYKLFPKNISSSEAFRQQKKNILNRIKILKTTKDAQLLEQRLNDLFYNKTGSDYEKYYQRAVELASEEFNKRYINYPFELNMDTMTAKFTNFDKVHFISKKTATLEEVKKVALELEQLLERTGKMNDKNSAILSKIQQLQNLSEWKDISSLNGIIASVLFGNKTVYGDAFEYVLAAFATVVNNKADTETEKLLNYFSEQALKGANRSSSYFDISHVSKEDRKNLKISGTIPINEGAVLEYKNTSQDKVDVVLNLEGVQYNISAKSYYNTSEIGILKGTSFLAPLINLSSVNFVSWYLSALYDNKYEQFLLPEAHDVLRINILLMALTGQGNSNSGLADTFILNDKSRKHIYVRTIYDLIYNILNENKILQYMIINNNQANIPDENLRNFQTQISPDEKNKISTMLNAIHQIKLQVALKGRAVRNIPSSYST